MKKVWSESALWDLATSREARQEVRELAQEAIRQRNRADEMQMELEMTAAQPNKSDISRIATALETLAGCVKCSSKGNPPFLLVATARIIE